MAYRVSSVNNEWISCYNISNLVNTITNRVHKTPGKLENVVFILKMYQMLYVHTNRENFKTQLLAVVWIGV